MEGYRNLIQQHLRIVRKLLIDVQYYRNYRASWEEDRSDELLYIAEVNLKEANRLVSKL